MHFTHSRFFVLCLLVGYAWSEQDDSVCTVFKKSCGLIPPPLPTNFEFKAEVADYVNNTLVWEEIYFDNTNLRGKIILAGNSVELHLIFDYTVSQIIQYIVLHPGAPMIRDPLSETCISVPMETSPWRFVFGYRDGNRETKHSRMYNSYQALRYGDQFQYSAQGVQDLSDRGLRTNAFAACVYDSTWDATLATTYYFSDGETLPPANVDEPLSVPVTIKMNGTVKTEQKWIPYITQQSLSWFKKNPEFSPDTFKIPQGLYCKDYRGSKPFPELPPAFSLRLEVTSFTQDMDGKLLNTGMLLFYTIWYNVEKGIARRDFTPLKGRDTEIFSKFQNWGPVTSIADFNSGVEYVINKESGRCYATALADGDFFVTRKDRMHVRMASPDEFLYMDRDTLEYKGKDFMRDIKCDLWAGTYYDADMNVTSFLETAISTDAWHEESDDKDQFGVPVRHTITTKHMNDDKYQQTVVESNFFKFKSSPPPLAVFNLHNTACIDTIDRKHIGMTLSITDNDLKTIQKYRFFFLEAVQYYLADITAVLTPLRVQSVRLEKIKGRNMVTFALLEKSKLKTKTPVTVLGADLKSAIENLQNYVDSGRFMVKFKKPDSDEFVTVLAEPNGLVTFRVPVEAFAEPEEKTEALTEFFTEKSFSLGGETQWFDDSVKSTAKPNVIKGMSPGGLAGLSISMLVIGIGVGIAIMYLYIKKYSDRSLPDNYAMQTKR